MSKFFEVARTAGVYTLDDLREFVKRERRTNETTLQALIRYGAEVQYG